MATEPSTQSMRLCDTDWELLESIEGVLEVSFLNTLSWFHHHVDSLS